MENYRADPLVIVVVAVPAAIFETHDGVATDGERHGRCEPEERKNCNWTRIVRLVCLVPVVFD